MNIDIPDALSVNAQMLIHKPATEVFAAFTDPKITTRFWFTDSSGPIEEGASVVWTWKMYNVSAKIRVRTVEKHKSIVFDWSPVDGEFTHVEFKFTELEDSTFVEVVHSGFSGTDDEIVAAALDSQGGFVMVLAGAKAWLEHKIELDLIKDAHPKLTA